MTVMRNIISRVKSDLPPFAWIHGAATIMEQELVPTTVILFWTQ